MIIQEIILPFDAQLPKARILRAGAISCMYENGNIRYIKLGDIEILSKVYGAVRDENWGTVPCRITEEKITKTEEGFIINYTAHYVQNELDYKADYSIEGKAGNSIVFTMHGKANATFKANRIGICVHHPIKECKEKTVIITKQDGMFYRSAFPKLISSETIFKQIKKMQWETKNNLTIHLLFEGAVFETEDQRNWSDSSYKTYTPPLTFPTTTELVIGETLLQTFTLRLSGITNTPTTVVNKIKNRKLPFPAIGYCRQNNDAKLTAAEIDMLGKIPFEHYRVTLFMEEKYWTHHLEIALEEAEKLNTKLQLVVYFGAAISESVNKLVYYLNDKQSLVQSILVLQHHTNVTPQDLLKQVYPPFKKALPFIKIGYGAASSFADLNRSRPIEAPCDFVSFGFNPQVHSTDARSFMESVQNQQDMMETLKDFTKGKEIYIGPVTLSHDNLNQLDKDEIIIANQNLHAALSMQTWLTAWWTLLTIQNCSAAKSISFFQLFGAQGLLQLSASINGEPPVLKASPLYEMLVTIKKFKPVTIIKKFLNENLVLDGLLLENKKHERLFFKVPDEILNFKKV